MLSLYFWCCSVTCSVDACLAEVSLPEVVHPMGGTSALLSTGRDARQRSFCSNGFLPVEVLFERRPGLGPAGECHHAGRRCGSSNVGGERLLAAPIAEAPPFSNRLVDVWDECVRVFAKRVTYSAVQECIRASTSERDLNEIAPARLCAALLTIHV